MPIRTVLLLITGSLAAALLTACAARPVPERAPLNMAAVPVQYGKGALEPVAFEISPADWARVESIFQPPPASPPEERDRIAAAIGVLEQIAGEQTRAGEDLGRNRSPYGSVGQMDCVDESTNTDHYLRLMNQQGLLTFHEVAPPVRRYVWLISIHRTAVLRDTESGELFAVDSWFHDNGHPAVVQPLEVWRTGRADPPRHGAVAASPGKVGARRGS